MRCKVGIIKKKIIEQNNPNQGLSEVLEVKRLIKESRVLAKKCNRLDCIQLLSGTENYLIEAEALFKKQIAKRGE